MLVYDIRLTHSVLACLRSARMCHWARRCTDRRAQIVRAGCSSSSSLLPVGWSVASAGPVSAARRRSSSLKLLRALNESKSSRSPVVRYLASQTLNRSISGQSSAKPARGSDRRSASQHCTSTSLRGGGQSGWHCGRRGNVPHPTHDALQG